VRTPRGGNVVQAGGGQLITVVIGQRGGGLAEFAAGHRAGPETLKGEFQFAVRADPWNTSDGGGEKRSHLEKSFCLSRTCRSRLGRTAILVGTDLAMGGGCRGAAACCACACVFMRVQKGCPGCPRLVARWSYLPRHLPDRWRDPHHPGLQGEDKR